MLIHETTGILGNKKHHTKAQHCHSLLFSYQLYIVPEDEAYIR